MMADPFEIARQDTQLEVQQTVNKTNDTIGDIGDPAGEESIVGLIKNIPEKVPTGAVKSVQRGFLTNVNQEENTVKINTVNPDKCIVILNFITAYVERTSSGIYLKSLTSDSLIFVLGPRGGDVSWQVIEYY